MPVTVMVLSRIANPRCVFYDIVSIISVLKAKYKLLEGGLQLKNAEKVPHLFENSSGINEENVCVGMIMKFPWNSQEFIEMARRLRRE